MSSISSQHDIDEERHSDPFDVDKLSVHYDYLLYKIQDHVSSIHWKTTEIVKKQNEIVDKGIIEEVIDVNIRELRSLLEKCQELENHFDLLNQIDAIVQNFPERIDQVIKEYKELKTDR